MIKLGILLSEPVIAAIIFFLGYQFLWHKFGRGARIAVLVLGFCAIFISFSAESMIEMPTSLSAAGFANTVCAVLLPAFGFGAALLLQCVLLTFFVTAEQKAGRSFLCRRADHGPFQKLMKYQFLFEELVKRDFKKKYKRTVLGMVWSVLSPLLTLLVMRIVFTQFFGRNMAHYTTYLFCGNLVFSYFSESTSQGMTSLMGNAGIFTKVNVPKYLFLFSKNIQTLINFCLTLCVFFVFCILDQITFTWRFILLLYPICFWCCSTSVWGLFCQPCLYFFGTSNICGQSSPNC